MSPYRSDGGGSITRESTSSKIGPPIRIESRPGSAVPRTRWLLAAYSDLSSSAGPVHARIIADLGERLLDGTPFPAYQAVAAASLRALISLDAPEIPYLDDPRELSVRDRSEHWQVLCDNLNGWQDLPAPERLRTLQVLAKLGFWQALDKTMDHFDGDSDERETRPLKHLHALARLRLDRTDADAAARIVSLNIDKATDVRLPAKARLSAALNLTVHYTKRGPVADARQWGEAAESLYSSRPSADFPLVLHSAYWRGISFASFISRDHTQTAVDLDRAEAAATQAVAEADEQDRLVVAENLLVLLNARERAAIAVGAVDAAESYYHRMISLDPLDSRFHLKLAHFLKDTRRTEEARAAYLRAAELGAPVTIHARAQAARCC